MCWICDDFKSKKIDAKETFRRMEFEMARRFLSPKELSHFQELTEEILKQEVPTIETDEFSDQQWAEEAYGDKYDGG